MMPKGSEKLGKRQQSGAKKAASWSQHEEKKEAQLQLASRSRLESILVAVLATLKEAMAILGAILATLREPMGSKWEPRGDQNREKSSPNSMFIVACVFGRQHGRTWRPEGRNIGGKCQKE